MDPTTRIAHKPVAEPADEFPDAVRIAGRWHLPNRRHLRPHALEAELRREGFRVIYRHPEHPGSLACVRRSCDPVGGGR